MVDTQSTPPATDTPPSDLPTRLGRNLAARRKALGLTQAQVAERLGVDTETLSRFERGKHVPSLLTLERLAAVLAATCAELLQEAPQPPAAHALVMETWLAGLQPQDAALAQDILKTCCEHLAARAQP